MPVRSYCFSVTSFETVLDRHSNEIKERTMNAVAKSILKAKTTNFNTPAPKKNITLPPCVTNSVLRKAHRSLPSSPTRKRNIMLTDDDRAKKVPKVGIEVIDVDNKRSNIISEVEPPKKIQKSSILTRFNKGTILDDDEAESEIALLAEKMAKGLYRGSTIDQRTLENNISRTANTTRYTASQGRLEHRFFKTILDHGGDGMQFLLVLEKPKHSIEEKEHFYFCICGTKNAIKKEILNFCMILCTQKWKKESGVMYEPGTMDTYLKALFAHLKANYIEYDYINNFNGKNSWQGQYNIDIKAQKKKVKSFGTQPKKAEFDPMSDTKITDAMVTGKLLPYTNWIHMISLLVYILGRFFGFRGDTEITNVEWSDVEQGQYGAGHPDKGFEYTLIRVGNGIQTKSTTLSAKNPTISSDELKVRIIEIPTLSWDPTRLIKYYRRCCPTDQKRFFYKESNSIETAFHRLLNNETHLRASNEKIGKHMITKCGKLLGLICGFKNFARCTNHAQRSHLLTHLANNNCNPVMAGVYVRHKGLESGNPYMRLNELSNLKLQ